MMIADFDNYPSRNEVREASHAAMVANAIAAWDAGKPGLALAWVGCAPDAIEVHGGAVWMITSLAPTGGNSPRPVRHTVKLTGSPSKCALAAHILTVAGRCG